MKSILLRGIVGVVGCSVTLFAASNAESIFDNKCAMCHMKTVPTDKSAIIAPPINGVMRHVKMHYPSKHDGVSFIVDYVQYPSQTKALCMKKKIARFGLMPSQKENISSKELEEVASWIYDTYPRAGFKGQGIMKGRFMKTP